MNARLVAMIVSVALTACARERPSGEEPARSRVQAVLSEPGSEPAPARVQPSPEPARAAPRPPLCEGQLSSEPKPFKPRTVPEQRSASGAAELPPNPLAGEARFRWVNFWAAWCVPCKQELPLLLNWEKSLQGELDMIFISLDDDERQLLAFLAAQPADGLKSSYWLPDGPTRAAWLDALGLETEPELPLQLLLDSSGKLRCRIQGAVEASDHDELARIVRR